MHITLTLKRHIQIFHFWPTWDIKEWSKDGKTFTRSYTTASKFWDEFNANFVLLNFSSYRSIKIWHLYFKNVEKKAVRLCIKTPKHFWKVLPPLPPFNKRGRGFQLCFHDVKVTELLCQLYSVFTLYSDPP